MTEKIIYVRERNKHHQSLVLFWSLAVGVMIFIGWLFAVRQNLRAAAANISSSVNDFQDSIRKE